MDLQTLWNHLSQLEIPLLEKIVRPILVYLFLIIGLRLAGKRELAQLNPFDFVVLLTLSNTVQNAIIGNDNSLIGGLVGAATLLALNAVAVRYLYGHRKLARWVEGDADILIEDGKVHPRRLARELITHEELEAAAHRQGFSCLADIDRCVLESGGTLTFVARRPSVEDRRQTELVAKIEELSRKLDKLAAR